MILTYTLATPTPTTVTPVEAVQDQLFGRDLLFGGDTALDAGGDYILVDGKDALRQSLYHRLLTTPGEYAFRPTYGAGLRQYVKRRLIKSELDAIRQRVVEQCALDDRIESVVECVVESYSIGDRPGIKVYVKILSSGQEIRLPMTFQER